LYKERQLRATFKSVFLPLVVLCLMACAATADEHTKDSLETVKKNLAEGRHAAG
jgi:outer membrane biogenesis lipoprotein LolB